MLLSFLPWSAERGRESKSVFLFSIVDIHLFGGMQLAALGLRWKSHRCRVIVVNLSVVIVIFISVNIVVVIIIVVVSSRTSLSSPPSSSSPSSASALSSSRLNRLVLLDGSPCMAISTRACV